MAQVIAVVTSEPLVAGIAAFATVGHLLLKLFPDLETVVFVVPSLTITRPWQVITAGYFEDSTFNLLLAVGLLLAVAVLLQPTWGGKELVRFVILTNALQGVATWVAMIALYILFRSEHFLFAQLGGLTGMLGGLSVALKQHAHDPLTLPLPVGASAPSANHIVRAAMLHAPSLCLLWSAFVLLTTHSGPPDELLFAANGILAAWVYLRYYQPREAGAAGDPSPEFSFAALFPSPLRPPLHALGGASFAIASMGGCFPPAGWAEQALVHGAPAPIAPPTLPDLLLTPMATPAAVTTSDPEVAERRRSHARALIEARLAEKAQKAATAGGRADDGGTPCLPSAVAAATPATPAPPPSTGSGMVAALATPATPGGV